MFWIICTLLATAVTAMVVVPMLRPPEAGGDDPQVALYKAQLAEVDRDVARDVIAPDEAERAKAEIARRLIAASREQKVTGQSPISRPVAIATAAAVLTAAVGTYMTLGAPGYPDLPREMRIAMGDEARENRPSQEALEAAAPVLDPPEMDQDYLTSVAQLRVLVPQRGDDLQGWQLLARHEANLRDYAAAADAQSRVVEIKGDDVSPEDLIYQADLLVAAADGFVSHEAEAVVRRLLDTDPNSMAGRYYLGALYDQTDRPDLALQLWRSILDSGAVETFHMALARGQVEMTAARAGTSYTPPPPVQVSVDDALADEDMTPEERTAMIEGMVNGLADRLATQGGPVDQWARLIVSYSVLGQTDSARAVLAEARDVFGASDTAMAVLDDAASRAGITP